MKRRCQTCPTYLSDHNSGSWCVSCEKARVLSDYYGDDSFEKLRLAKSVAEVAATPHHYETLNDFLAELSVPLSHLVDRFGFLWPNPEHVVLPLRKVPEGELVDHA